MLLPPSADRAHDHADGPTHGGATGANATDAEATPEALNAKSEAGAAASPETHDAARTAATTPPSTAGSRLETSRLAMSAACRGAARGSTAPRPTKASAVGRKA